MRFESIKNLRLSQLRKLKKNGFNISLLIGSEFLQIGPIGSRKDYLQINLTKCMVRVGCFYGTLDEFSSRVDEVYTEGLHRIEYTSAIAMARALIAHYRSLPQEVAV